MKIFVRYALTHFRCTVSTVWTISKFLLSVTFLIGATIQSACATDEHNTRLQSTTEKEQDEYAYFLTTSGLHEFRILPNAAWQPITQRTYIIAHQTDFHLVGVDQNQHLLLAGGAVSDHSHILIYTFIIDSYGHLHRTRYHNSISDADDINKTWMINSAGTILYLAGGSTGGNLLSFDILPNGSLQERHEQEISREMLTALYIDEASHTLYAQSDSHIFCYRMKMDGTLTERVAVVNHEFTQTIENMIFDWPMRLVYVETAQPRSAIGFTGLFPYTIDAHGALHLLKKGGMPYPYGSSFTDAVCKGRYVFVTGFYGPAAKPVTATYTLEVQPDGSFHTVRSSSGTIAGVVDSFENFTYSTEAAHGLIEGTVGSVLVSPILYRLGATEAPTLGPPLTAFSYNGDTSEIAFAKVSHSRKLYR